MTKTYEELQAQLKETENQLDARRAECHDLYVLNHGLRTTNEDLRAEIAKRSTGITSTAWENFRLRATNEELRQALLKSAERTNAAAIAAATYKEGVHHAS